MPLYDGGDHILESRRHLCEFCNFENIEKIATFVNPIFGLFSNDISRVDV